MKTSQLQEGMKIDQAIIDRMDRTLIMRGTLLNAYLIDSLAKLGIRGVYVCEGEDDPEPEIKEEKLPVQVRRNIEKYRQEDPSKVQLKESVKKRVSEGIQFLYSNADSADFADTTENISQDLMQAINDNAAIAIDISALKTSDEYTFKHSVDVATISMIIAKQQKKTTAQIHEIGIAGLLHDMGKSRIPLEILNKPARLTDEEFEVMKQHSVLGYNILKEKEEFSKAVSLAVLQHHEKMNGKGYPLGCRSDKIINYAKILSVADVYDALVTTRPYKKAFSQRVAIEMIMSMTEDLDIECMRSFLSSVILYPVDSVVQLSNGEKARVVKNNRQSILRPTVVGLTTGTVYDLANDLDCAHILIE